MGRSLRVYILMFGAFLAVTAELILVGVVHLIAQDLRVSLSVAGQLVTAYAIAFAVGAPLVITLTVQYDRKKILTWSFILFLFSCLIASWSPDYLVLLVSRVLLGLSGGVFTVVAMSTISKLVLPEKLGNSIGVFMLGLSGALVLGVPFGIVISGWLNWKTAFGIMALLSGIVLFLIIWLIPSIPGGEPQAISRQLSLFKNSRMVNGFIITLFWGAGYSVFFTFLGPYLTEIADVNTTYISFAMFILGVFSMIGTRLGGIFTDRWGVRRTVYISLLAHAITLLLLPQFTTTIMGTLIVLAFWAASSWMTSPAMQTYFIRQSPQSPDLALSLNTSMLQLGFALGAGLGGVVVNSAGTVTDMPWIGGCMIVIGIMMAVLTFVVEERARRRKHG